MFSSFFSLFKQSKITSEIFPKPTPKPTLVDFPTSESVTDEKACENSNSPQNDNETDSEISTINFYDVETANILVVGPTGTGKTTFINTLRKPTYTSLVNIDSQTREAEMTSNLFEFGGRFFMMQVIDTPGFGDSSAEGKTDFELEEMILKFVKQGIAQLHLVLVAVRFGVRYNKPQIESIMNVLRFLGRDMRNNTALLFTNAENTTDDDRKNWISLMENSEAKNILRFCNGRAFFTGMCTDRVEIDKTKFVQRIRNDHFQIIHAATNATPITLHGDDHDSISNQFKVYESAAKNSLTIKRLVPELPELLSTFFKIKDALTPFSDHHEVAQLFEKWKEIEEDDINCKLIEWNKFQDTLEDYFGIGSALQINSENVRIQYTLLKKANSDLIALLDEVNLFG